MKGRRFCNSLSGITLNMLYRQDETNLRHIIECNKNDMGAQSPEDYFKIDMEAGCHVVNDKLLEEDTVLTNVEIASMEAKPCLFYHHAQDSGTIKTKAQLNDRLMSRCREIFNCKTSDAFSSSAMDRRAIKTQMIKEIKDILTDVDDTKGGYSTISIASATELLTEVVETYVTTRFDNVNRITHSYVHLKKNTTHTKPTGTVRSSTIFTSRKIRWRNVSQCGCKVLVMSSIILCGKISAFETATRYHYVKQLMKRQEPFPKIRRNKLNAVSKSATNGYSRKRINPKEIHARIKRQRCHVPMASRPQ